MKNLIIFSLVLFFSTNTFVNNAKSLEYTVLSDAEVKYLLQFYSDINDLWFGIYVYDSEGVEEKLGYMHLWSEEESSFSCRHLIHSHRERHTRSQHYHMQV